MGILTIDKQFSSMLVPLIHASRVRFERRAIQRIENHFVASVSIKLSAHTRTNTFSVLRIRSNMRNSMSRSDSVHVNGAYKIPRVSSIFNSINLMLDVLASFVFLTFTYVIMLRVERKGAEMFGEQCIEYKSSDNFFFLSFFFLNSVLSVSGGHLITSILLSITWIKCDNLTRLADSVAQKPSISAICINALSLMICHC